MKYRTLAKTGYASDDSPVFSKFTNTIRKPLICGDICSKRIPRATVFL
jgi:hypothetical protein